MSNEEVVQVSIGLMLRELDEPQQVLKTVLLGDGPLILITPSAVDVAGELKLHFDIDATGVSTKEALADILSTVIDALRDGEPA